MKFFHTADWHLGKIVQGVHMTDDQRYVLDQFIEAIEKERPDAVIIAGDLYDRAVPPTDAIDLLNEVFEKIVLELQTPVLAIGGNHDSPGRLNFGSNVMKANGLHLVGQYSKDQEPVILKDEYGEVHVHLIPYCDPSVIRAEFQDDNIRTHNDAVQKITEHLTQHMSPKARHIFVGHSFVTPYGEEKENTSESERPLSIGGAEYVEAKHFANFHYTALGHLHQAHYVSSENIRYAGSILKYSISEEHHNKGFFIVDMDEAGDISVRKQTLKPYRDMRTVEGTMDQLLSEKLSEDYVFVKLTDETPVLHPMEKIRSVFPNAMHIERKHLLHLDKRTSEKRRKRTEMSDLDLFKAFYQEINGNEAPEEMVDLFKEVLDEELRAEREDIDKMLHS